MTALRRCFVGALAVAGLMAGAPAMATRYYYCYLDNAYGPEGYVYTPILQTSVERVDEDATGMAFYEFASSRVTNDIGGGIHYACNSSPNIGYIREMHANWVEEHGGIEVEWADPPIPSEPMEDSPPTDSLVIEEQESLTVPPEELAAMALAEERKRAAALAKALAENARRDAELDAKLQESIRRAKRRGRMQ